VGTPVIVALAATAWADPPPSATAPELLRLRQPVRTVRYTTATFRDGQPPSLRGRGRSGPIEAWVWPDGTAARVQRASGRGASEVRWYDPSGLPWVTVHLERGDPVDAVSHQYPDVAIDLAGWTSATVGPAAVRGPGVARVTADATHWGDGAHWTARFVAGAIDVGAPGFAEGLSEGCGCVLTDRTTALAGQTAGVRFSVALPRPTQSEIGELWAFPRTDGVLVLSWTAPRSDDPTHPELAPGRIAVALLEWLP
jgi:hypothetical protein